MKMLNVSLGAKERMTRRIYPIKVLGLVALVVLGALLILNHTSGMFKVCLFSPVKGKVVFKGQPVAGAVIERHCKWNWKKTEQTDQTTTDVNGEFSMPGIYSWMGVVQLVPHEPVIHQQLEIKHEGRTYNAWTHFKHEYGEFAELDICKALGDGPSLDGKPIDLLCDLGVESKNHFGGSGWGGIGELRR
ncbi:MAG: hypothetical protein QM715_13800 [Nibricoccus sp.]